MDLSYNWLKKHVDLDGISPQELADRITLAGLEVEGMTHLAQANHLVVGEVVSVKEHPDSDNLKVTQVNIGEEVLQIVCGADNVAEKQKVIVATEGAKLPDLTIKPVVLRGVESNGMICSLSELGVSETLLSEEQKAGIEVLSDEAEIGNENVLGMLGLDDVILDVDLTPNRSDCLSMFALAKEVSAILDRPYQLPEIKDYSQGEKATLKVKADSEDAYRIAGKHIGKLTIKESPEWIKQTLLSQGINPKNNVVDISNLVMLETGQPLHFYDAKSLEQRELVVVDNYEGSYQALDGETYDIKHGDLMIMSNQKPIGIAGIMGGDDTKITEDTVSIVIESAQFNLVNIRTTSRNLNITTDASLRFSRALDPNAMHDAINRATELLIEYADAQEIEETVYDGDLDIEERKIATTKDYLNNRLGTNFSIDEIMTAFERLSFKPVLIDNVLHVSIPTYRQDIVHQVDLSEELIRIIGYDVLDSTMPRVTMTAGGMDESLKQRKKLKTILRGAGFHEMISYSLVSKEHLNYGVMAHEDAVKIANPLSSERSYYRTSLLPSMLDVISYNEARKNHEYQLFEIANTYDDHGTSDERLALAMSSYLEVSRWQNLKTIGNFYHLKGELNLVFEKLGIHPDRIEYKAISEDYLIFHPNQSAEVYIDRKLIGVLGRIHPKLKDKLKINDVVLAELKLSEIYQLKRSKVRYREIPKYPSIVQDLAAIVPEEVLAADLIETIKSVDRLIEEAEVFDVYTGENVAEGMKSLAIRVMYQSLEHTLTDQEVAEIHDEIIDRLKEKHNIIYREQ